MYSYENELNALKNAQKQAAVSDLENTRNTTLSNLEAENQKNMANYASQRNTANVQNKLGNKNFQEYLASTGRANSGLNAQAQLTSRNNLNTQLNNITNAENTAKADINRQITNANSAYASGIASANANAEANYINNLLDQRYKQQQLQQQEREFNESVRQFNEKMALERQQMYSNFRSGSSKKSGGGGSAEKTESTKPVATKNQYSSAIGPGLNPGESQWYSKIVENNKKKSNSTTKKSTKTNSNKNVFNTINYLFKR